MATSMRCSPTVAEAVVDDQRHGARHDAAAGVLLVEPVADRGELRRAAHDVVDRHLSGEAAVDLDRERHVWPCARLAAQPRAPAGGTLPARAPAPGRARWRPTAAARRRCGCAGSRQRVAVASGRAAGATTSPCDEPRRPAAGSVVAPDDLLDRVPQHRLERRRGASFTPPREPGRLTTRQVADHAGQPARQHRGRHALADAVRRGSPRRCRAPRGRAAARVASGVRSVGVSPVPPVVSTTRAPASTAARIASPTGSPSGTTAGRRDRRSRARSRSRRRSAGRWRRRRRRRPRGWTRPRRPPAELPASSRLQSPDRPPDLVSTRTSVMTAPLSTALTMSTTVSAGDRDGGEGLHLDAGAVGGAHGGDDLDGVVGDDEVDGHAGDRQRVAQRDQRGRLLGAHDPGDPGHGEGVALGHARHRAAARRPRRETSTRPDADAVRAVTSLADTSTMRAAPCSSTWVSRSVGRPSELLVEHAAPATCSPALDAR